jgi:hypothetical protein
MPQETNAIIIRQVIFGKVRSEHHVTDGSNADSQRREVRSWFDERLGFRRRFLHCFLHRG